MFYLSGQWDYFSNVSISFTMPSVTLITRHNWKIAPIDFRSRYYDINQHSFITFWIFRNMKKSADCYSKKKKIPLLKCGRQTVKKEKQFASLKCEIPPECSCSLKRIKHTDCWIWLVLSQKASDFEADFYYSITLSDPIAIPPLPGYLPLKGKHNLFCSLMCSR